MKITSVISDMNVGGAGVLLSSLASALSGKFKMEVILPRGSKLKDRLCEEGVKVYELDFSGDKSFDKKDVLYFYNFFKRNKTELLHTHATLSARLGAKAAGVPRLISTRHCAREGKIIPKMGILQRTVYNYCTDITVSTADKATKDLYAEGVPTNRIVTIKNGVSERKTLSPCEISSLKKSIGIPNDGIVVGVCARLEKVKGLDLAIRALSSLSKKYPSLYLVLLGEGSEKDNLTTLSATLGILPKVKFLGYKKDVSPYQNIFFLNLNTSRGTETSCLAISECMSIGIPTVASDFGGNTEMITHGENGLIFKSESYHGLMDSIELLLSDKALYAKLSEGAKRIYRERFSLERMVKSYEALYYSLFSDTQKNQPCSF